MNVEQFWQHHEIARNPFSEEDAQTDPVFKNHCIRTAFHPAWQKVIGDPEEPSTSVVFGEKGAGKTAMRLQIERSIGEHNHQYPRNRVFLIRYDDWNPFLDQFKERSRRRHKVEKMLGRWQLWDHMDAILSVGTTQLVNQLLDEQDTLDASVVRDPHQKRDLLLLLACYDHTSVESYEIRWRRLQKKLGYNTFAPCVPNVIGVIGTILAVTLLGIGVTRGVPDWFFGASVRALLLASCVVGLGAWVPYATRFLRCFFLAQTTVQCLRTVPRSSGTLAKLLTHFSRSDLAGQPLPNKQRTDDRYELLGKLQGVLKVWGYEGVVVVIDRVDEPHLVNGMPTRMRALVWPLLDNKFLKQPGLGIKLMLPSELVPYLDREGRDFHQRARLDKQNVIPSLEWTGEALQDVANARIAACAQDGMTPRLRNLFDDEVSSLRILDMLRTLRVPRHLFKFLYRLVVAHCNAHTDDAPAWKISAAQLESTLAVYLREQDLADHRLQV